MEDRSMVIEDAGTEQIAGSFTAPPIMEDQSVVIEDAETKQIPESFTAHPMMEDRSVVIEDAETEQIPESFICCICLDLLYKPVVLSCGHISCFWCVHKSMSGLRESQCPLCRQPYLHFPSICLLLHFLLLKMYPDSYRRREIQTVEEEKEMGIYSPQFDALAWKSGIEEQQKLSSSSRSHMTYLGPKLSMDATSSRNGEPHANKRQVEPVGVSDGYGPSSAKQDWKQKHDTTVEEENVHLVGSDQRCKQITVSDVLCAVCKQFLYRPVALNCGHVYCECCIVYPADEKIKCKVCQSQHPGLPKVCLELDHFLEQQFPKECALRRLAARPRLTSSENDNPQSRNKGADTELKNSSRSNDTSMPHWGVGCDYCGMYPIIGDRYQCRDCVEKIGFDLCGDCYNSRHKLPGRFNQQHRPDHKFKLRRHSPALVLSTEDSEGVYFISPTSPAEDEVMGVAENSPSINLSFEDDVDSEHENNSQSNS